MASVYRRLNWARQMLEYTIAEHRTELERAGLRLYVATHSVASGRMDRYISVDGPILANVSPGAKCDLFSETLRGLLLQE